MRLFVSIIASAAMLFAASAASAATVYSASTTVASGNDLGALVPGDVVVIEITARTDGEATFGLTASAIGYDPAIAQYTSGTSVTNVLASACIAAFGCINSLDNTAFANPTESLANPLGPEVQFVNAIGTAAGGGDGSADLGVDGTEGGAQFRLVFTAGAPGSTTITLGSDANYGDATIGDMGAILATTNAEVSLTVIPEPGTALLMGLGLAGLAAAGRRE